MSIRGLMGKSGIGVVAASAAFGMLSRIAWAQVTTDGLLDQEAQAVLDLNASGLPDILDGRQGVNGVAFFRLDGIRAADIEGSFPDAGPDGFRDAGYSDIPTVCTDCLDDRQIVRSALNTGKLTIIYLADSDGVIGQCSGASSNPGDPCTKDADCPGGACTTDLAADDSLFYVGLDIYNGDRRDVGNPAGVEDVDFHHIDFVDTVPVGDICQDGVADFDSNGVPDFIAVPFDVDGDGEPMVATRWNVQPTQPCQPDDVAEVDLSGEQYRVYLYLCAPLPEELDTDPSAQLPANIGQLFLRVTDGSAIVAFGKSSNLVLPGGTSASDFFASYPADGDSVSTIAGDVEFLVRHADTLIHAQCGRGTFPPVNCTGNYALDRFQFARGGIRTMSDADADGSDEDWVTATWLAPLPEIEVGKFVRCEGDSEWHKSVEGFPGSTLEFKIEVENTGNVDLAVCLEDVLEELVPADVTPDPSSLRGELCRPADGPCVPINPASPPDGVNQTFFIPSPLGFLGAVADGTSCEPGESRNYLGVLRRVDVCTDAENPILGDKVVITFVATVDDAFDACATPLTDVDVTNDVTAIGDPDIPPGTSPLPPDGDEVSDSDQVTADLLCRDITFAKTARATNRNNQPLDPQGLPPFDQSQFPITVTYTYNTTNEGERDEVVAFTDPPLCKEVDDLVSAGWSISFGTCPICPSGWTTTIPPNQTRSTRCEVEFGLADGTGGPEALGAFLAYDDTRINVCVGGTDTGKRCTSDSDCPGATCEELPGAPDPRCYRNWGVAVVSRLGLPNECDRVDIYKHDETVCAGDFCVLDVIKEVKCDDDADFAQWICDSNSSNPGETCIDARDCEGGECVSSEPKQETFARNASDLGQVLNFRMVVKNIGPPPVPVVCLTDDLSCEPWLISGSFQARFIDASGVELPWPFATPTPADLETWFSTDRTRRCFEFDPPIPPDEGLQFTFDVRVPREHAILNMDPDCHNCLEVEGYLEAGTPEPPPLPDDDPCTQEDCAEINVLVPDIGCDKTVCAVDAAGVDHGCGSDLLLMTDDPAQPLAFPLTLTYTLSVENPVASSETPLKNVEICDLGLVTHANGTAPNEVYLGPCDLDPGTGCADLPGIPVGGSAVAGCTIIVPSYEAWTVFAGLGGVGDETCYDNLSEAAGVPDVSDDVCGEQQVEAECDAGVCIPPPCLCDVEVLKEACILPPPNGGGEGCTPGFWKNHLDAWPEGIQPTDDFDTIFGVEAFDPNVSLIDALNRGGGGIFALGRHATSALLNASSGAVDYAMTVAEVIAAVQATLSAGGDIEGTKDQLASFNEEGCPIGRGGRLDAQRTGTGRGTAGLQEPTECLPAIPCGTPTEVEFTYTVWNPTDCALLDVSVIDDLFGEIPSSPIDVLGPGERVVLTLRVTLSEETTNTVTVIAHVAGETCDATSTVTVPEDCNGGSCRMTGGGVDGTVPPHAWVEATNGNNYYTFGGQAGAPTGSQPQPWGEWTHRQHRGDDGKFTFHAGTASAPEGTEIDLIECHDPDNCNPARHAPFKQIDFEGVGSFKNITGDTPAAPFVRKGESLHWFHVHVEDLGEPGNYDPEAVPCPVGGHVGLPPPANCGCPDFYGIRIHATEDPGSNVIYEVSGYINGGNLQIHPAIGE